MKRLFLTIIAFMSFLLTGAQTLQQGRNLFNQGNYEKAKPIMLKYLKQKPQDASRNYWYGVCCMETGEQEKAIPYLETAAEKNIFKASRALGEYYMSIGEYQLAISNFEDYVSGISADKEQHDTLVEARYTQMADSLKTVYRMIRSTSRACFIDSMVISKEQLFTAYAQGEAAGSVGLTAGLSGTNAKSHPSGADWTDGEAFVPENRQSIIYSHMDNDSIYRLYSRYRSYDGWDDASRLQGLDTDGDLRYPFQMNDGVTIYYAATGSESLGGLDIFVSRINPATGTYFRPRNIGMPFNSAANDYLLVIDEYNNLGWFATDRNQPSDSVCVYVFVPDDMERYYNYEDGDRSLISRIGGLESIALTQTDPGQVQAARQRLLIQRFGQSASKGHSFTYTVDDLTVYHEADDFQSADARAMFQEWMKLRDEYSSQSAALDRQRTQYAGSGASDRNRMRAQLLQLEERVLEMERTILSMENEIRTLEINYLNRK